jgi:hypothetical protein
MRAAAILVVLMTVVVSGCALNPRVRPEDCESGIVVEINNRGGYQAQVFLISDDVDPTFLGTVGPGQTEVFSVGSGRAWVRLRTEDGRRASAAVQRLGGGVVMKHRCR